jgi:hypothetical protein
LFGEIEPPHLIDAGNDLVEPIVVVELRDPVQRRVDRIELRLLVEEAEALHVPGGVAGIRGDHHLRHRRD